MRRDCIITSGEPRVPCPYGDAVRAARVEAGYTLRECASLLGMSPVLLSHIQQGELPTKIAAAAIERLLGIATPQEGAPDV